MSCMKTERKTETFTISGDLTSATFTTGPYCLISVQCTWTGVTGDLSDAHIVREWSNDGSNWVSATDEHGDDIHHLDVDSASGSGIMYDPHNPVEHCRIKLHGDNLTGGTLTVVTVAKDA